MRDQRKRDAGHRQGIRDARHVEERLHREGGHETSREIGPKRRYRTVRDHQPACEKNQIKDQQHRTTDQTQLFRKRGIDEIAGNDRDHLDGTLPKSLAMDSAREHRRQPLKRLPARSGRIGERIPPNRKARRKMPDRMKGEHGNARHKHPQDDQPPTPGSDKQKDAYGQRQKRKQPEIMNREHAGRKNTTPESDERGGSHGDVPVARFRLGEDTGGEHDGERFHEF